MTIARNIGTGGRRQRLVSGGAGIAVGVAAAVLMLVSGADRGLRVILFLPFALGAIGLLQARDAT
jgi:hypothetical protein